MTDEFIAILERFLGFKRTPISIADTWASNTPKEAGGKTPMEYLEMSAVWRGRRSYRVNSFVIRAIAAPFTKEECAQGVAEMKVFRTWIQENVMGQDKDTVIDVVMVMPFGAAAPKYRDDANKLPSIVGSFPVFYLAAVLQLPTLIIPIGQKPYYSRISGLKEYLLIVSSFMGVKGSDLMLLNLAEAAFKGANWPTEVKTGRQTFAVGDGVRNVL